MKNLLSKVSDYRFGKQGFRYVYILFEDNKEITYDSSNNTTRIYSNKNSQFRYYEGKTKKYEELINLVIELLLYDKYQEQISNLEVATTEDQSKIEDKIEQLKIERKRLNASKLEVNRLENKVTRIENAFELITNQIKALEPPKFTEHVINKQDTDYILCLSDLHIGARFENYTNAYSFLEVKNRLNKIVDYISSKKIEHLYITNTGDIIQNILRISDIKLNESTVVESVVQAMMMISSFLNALSKHCKTIDYYCVYGGNHDYIRYLNDKSFTQESLCLIITEYLKVSLSRNTRVAIHDDYIEETMQFKCGASEVCIIHGNELGKKDFENGIRIYNSKFQKNFNILISGHYHSTGFKQVGINEYVVSAPSLVGSCPYSRSLHLDSPACALLLEIRGKDIQGFKNIILN